MIRKSRQRRISVRLRLALSYAFLLELAGGVTLLGVYLFFRFAPPYPIVRMSGGGGAYIEIITTNPQIRYAILSASTTIMIVLGVMGVVGGWVLAGWVLRPLQRIHDGARIVATGRLDHRIELTNRNDEFGDLADTFDTMLDRLQDAFATQERFAANASHELRTPLTVMNTMLDVARRDPGGQDYPQLLERLSITNARAIGLTESLLRLADANAITASSERLDLATIAEDVAADQEEDAAAQGITIDTRLAPSPMIGDRALVTQLVFNLVQNAIRHNLPSGTIAIRTWHDPTRRTTSILVENTGLPISRDLAARLTEPFLRGAGRIERSSREQRGFGLGLALVDRITDVHQGTLAILPHDMGGLTVTVTFPANAMHARATT